MKEKLSLILCLVFLGTVLVTAVVYNRLKPRVMVLQSYEPDYAWTRDIDRGLRRVMDKWTGYSVTWHYMDTKKLSDPKWLKRAGIIARRVIEQTNPRVLIAVDDLAQALAAKYFVNHPTMDIVFAGVNGSVEPYGYTGAVNVTGIYEHKQLRAIKEVILALEAGKEKPTPTPSVAYILDPSPSLSRGRAAIDRYSWYPVAYQGSTIATDYPHWKTLIKQLGSRADYLIVANYRKLHTQGPGSPYADPHEVMAWTEKHAKAPVIGINAFNVEDGAMVSIGVSPLEQGEMAAATAQEIITRNIRAGQIPIKQTRQYLVAIRKSSLQARALKLPAIYEAFGRATGNYIGQ